MTEELDKKLVKKYPKIFADRNAPMNQTAMCWGFDCGDGWYWLIDNLCSNLQWNIDKNDYPQVVAVQVKEKWGGLRFYIGGAKPEQHAVVSFVESLSNSVCEPCGATKNIGRTQFGWIKTLCRTCAEELEELNNWKLV